MKHCNLAHQLGSKLTSIPVGLIIIGLLLGGVMKGQELVENIKIDKYVGNMNGARVVMNPDGRRYEPVLEDDVTTGAGLPLASGLVATNSALAAAVAVASGCI